MSQSSPYGFSERSGIRRDAAEQAESKPQRKSAYLHSGYVHVSAEPASITTILGSCVAVCIWDSMHGVGGATHYLLPESMGRLNASGRFGNCAIDQLISGLLEIGAQRRNLQAKIFGGASIFAGLRSPETQLGTKNVQVAVRILEREEVPVVTYDVGGRKGRKLIFDTDSGDAWVKMLSPVVLEVDRE